MIRISSAVMVAVTCDLCGDHFGDASDNVLVYSDTGAPEQPWRADMFAAGWRGVAGWADAQQCDDCAHTNKADCAATGHDFIPAPTADDIEKCRTCPTTRVIPGSRLDDYLRAWKRGELVEHAA